MSDWPFSWLGWGALEGRDSHSSLPILAWILVLLTGGQVVAAEPVVPM